MRGKIVYILVMLLVLTVSIPIPLGVSNAIGDDACCCQSADCLYQMERLCTNIGADHIGWYMQYGVCFMGHCETGYRVVCQKGHLIYYTYTTCTCFDNRCGY